MTIIEFIRIFFVMQVSIQSKLVVNEKLGANNFVLKVFVGNLSYEVENNVAKAFEVEISKGTSEEGGSSVGI